MSALLAFALLAQSPRGQIDVAAAAEYSRQHGGVSFLLMRDGRIVHEEYPNGGRADRAWELASGTKSFSGVTALCAEQDGLLALDEPASKTLTEWRTDDRKAITVRQILSLCSGITGGTGPLAANRVPTYKDAITYPANAKPGTKFQYGAVPYMIWGEILRRKLETRGLSVQAYMEEKIFTPLKMEHGFWRKEADGYVHLPSGLAMTAREWAKFGEMIRLKGRGVLPASAVDELWRPSPANRTYGLTWWLPMNGPKQARSKALKDVHMAAGAGGQRLFVIASHGLTIVRQAPVRGSAETFKDAQFLAALFPER